MISKDHFPKSFKLQNVSLLELRTGYTQYDLIGMAALLELCPNLETMILHYLYKIGEDVSIVTYVITTFLDVARQLSLSFLSLFWSCIYNFDLVFSRRVYQKRS